MMTLKNNWLNRILIILLVFTSCTKKITDYSFEKTQFNAKGNFHSIYSDFFQNRFILAGGDNWTKGEIFVSKDKGSTWENYSLDSVFNKAFFSVSGESTVYSKCVIAGNSGIWAYWDTTTSKFIRKQIPNWHNFKKIYPEMMGLSFETNYVTITNNGNSDYLSTYDYQGNLLKEKEFKFTINSYDNVSGKKFLCGLGGIMKQTSVLNDTWEFLDIENDDFMDIKHIFNSKRTTIYVVGYSGAIYISNDWGENWTILKKKKSSDNFNCIKQIDQNRLWAIGNNGLVVEINNEDFSYKYVKNDIKENLYDFIILGNKVFIAGSNATLWTTSLN